ncbi:MAG: LysR family transcriptional regulator [Pseudomonadota bacterium]
MIDLNTLTVFDAVVAAGSFTAAAERLGVAKAKVSIQVGRLEHQLGVTLFARTTRKVTLTDAGRLLHEQCQPMLAGLHDALAQAGSELGELHGSLRLATTVNHAQQSLAPAVAAFAAIHQDLRIDLRTGDRISDLVAEGIDLSFRMGWLRDSSQRAIKLGEFAQHVMAAPSYLKQHGAPKQPSDLAAHAWVALSLLSAPTTWKFTDASGHVETVHMKARLQTDSPTALLALVERGAGVTAMDSLSAQPAIAGGTLVRLLPAWSLPVGGIYAVLPPGRHVPPKVRAFIDFYRRWLG